jgi:hypothetical protein
MRRTTVFASAAALVFSAVTAFAQAPNFAGKWTLQVDPNAAAGGGGGGGGGRRGGGGGGRGGFGMNITITQDAKTLVVASVDGQGVETKQTFNLDGTETNNPQAGRGGGAPTDRKSTVKVEAGKVTITTKQVFGEMTIETTRVLELAGADLKITTTGMGGGRGGAAAATPPAPQVVTYKKG